jgi:hypothetical protein
VFASVRDALLSLLASYPAGPRVDELGPR